MRNDRENKLRKGKSCVYFLHVQVVLLLFSRILIGRDHVHPLVEYLPKVSIAKLVNSLKGVFSRLLEENYLQMASYHWKGALLQGARVEQPICYQRIHQASLYSKMKKSLYLLHLKERFLQLIHDKENLKNTATEGLN